MKSNPLRSRTNLSTIIGLWLGLTAVVGVCAFVAIYLPLIRPAAPAATNTPSGPTEPATQALAATNTPPPVPQVTDLPTAETDQGGPPCNFRPEPASGFAYGIQSHVFVGDNSYWLGVITDKLG